MDYYLTLDHWSSLVRRLKDEERENDVPAQETSDLAKDILLVIRSARFKQGVLFRQKRGEEYEMFVEALNHTYDNGAVKRILSNDEFWDVSFSLR